MIRKFLCIVYVLNLCNCLSAQIRYNLNFNYDGFNRDAIISVPSTSPPTGGYPIVIMLHGTGQDGELFYETSGWKELGAQENFITIFPTSLRWCYVEDGFERNNYRWVNGNVTENPCSGPPQNYVDDVRFLKKLVSLVSDTVSVNASKIFASGFSNGSSMVHKLANDAGDVFAAVAGSGAPLSAADSTNPVNRIPVWFMLGTRDDRYIVPPFTELPFGGDSILIYLQTPLKRAIACQGLDINSFEKLETNITHNYKWNRTTNGEISQTPYLFTIADDMYHVYPNGTNYAIEAAKIFWAFFKQSVIVSSYETAINNLQIKAMPNPSGDRIQIRVESDRNESPMKYKLINSIGQEIFSGKLDVNSILEINKYDTGSGLFIFQLQSVQGLQSKRIVFY